MAEILNNNNIKNLKALKKQLENEFITTWPAIIIAHKTAIINALTNSIEVCEIAKANGGIITLLDGFMAAHKTDLFSSQSPSTDNT